MVNNSDKQSSFENNPAISEPKETIIAPVSVAISIILSGLYVFST